MGNSPENIFILKLDPEPEKLSEHGARIFGSIRNPSFRPHTNYVIYANLHNIGIMCRKFYLDDLKLWEEFETQNFTNRHTDRPSADSSIPLLISLDVV